MLTDDEFDDIRQKATVAWHRGDIARALAEIEKVLGEGTSDMKGECLLYRGMMRQSGEPLSEARQDWSEALQYAGEGTFLRFQLEQHVGDSLEREGLFQEAFAWYRKALKTCSEGEEFSGHQILSAYLRLNGRIDPGDEPLIASVAVKSWRVLELPGAPDLSYLRSAIEELAVTVSNRVETIVRAT